MASGIDICASPDVERVGAACKIMGQLVRTAGAHALCEVPGHVPWAGTAHNRHPRAECLPTAAIIAPHPPRRARPCAPLPLPGSPRCAVTLSSPQRTPKATRCVSGWTTRRWCRHSCALSLHFRRSRGLSRMPCGPCCTSPSQVRHARHAVCSEGGQAVCAHDSVWACCGCTACFFRAHAASDMVDGRAGTSVGSFEALAVESAPRDAGSANDFQRVRPHQRAK